MLLALFFLFGLVIRVILLPSLATVPDAADFYQRFKQLSAQNEGCPPDSLQWLRFEWQDRQVTWLIPEARLFLQQDSTLYLWDEDRKTACRIVADTVILLDTRDPTFAALQQVRKQICPWVFPFRNWSLYQEMAEWEPVPEAESNEARAVL